ncbi:MAG: hypothetical protein MZV63_33000 [Marinilabiliales bacterium]|nr:hypothetical protein [Marinilabiliales bacterium]
MTSAPLKGAAAISLQCKRVDAGAGSYPYSINTVLQGLIDMLLDVATSPDTGRPCTLPSPASSHFRPTVPTPSKWSGRVQAAARCLRGRDQPSRWQPSPAAVSIT